MGIGVFFKKYSRRFCPYGVRAGTEATARNSKEHESPRLALNALVAIGNFLHKQKTDTGVTL
jgi:hypothetical protein